MAPATPLTAASILAAQAQVQRQGRTRSLQQLEEAQPELAEYLMENLARIHQQLMALGGPVRPSQELHRQIESLLLIVIQAHPKSCPPLPSPSPSLPPSTLFVPLGRFDPSSTQTPCISGSWRFPMSHEIDLSTGVPAVFTSHQPAWHRLGKTIASAATSAQAIDLAGLNWSVCQWPVHAVNPSSGQASVTPHHRANVRMDTQAVLGIVSPTYQPFQNRDAFDFMDSLVGDKLAMFETAGAIKEGRKVWMLARIPKEYRAGPEDLIKPYVLLVNSFDGSTSLRMLPTTIRVVCQNTLNLALKQQGGEGLAIQHKSNLDLRVRQARQKLGVIAARFDRFDEELHAMLQTPLTTRKVARYFEGLLPDPTNLTDRQRRHRDLTMTHFQVNLENDRNTLAGIRGTAWAAYNAVSEWADHAREVRGVNEQARLESRLDSIWFGSSHRIKQQAYRDALALTAMRN